MAAFNIPRFDFSGGPNTKVSDFLRANNEVVKLENADSSIVGSIKLSPGYDQLGAAFAGAGDVMVYQHEELTTSTRILLAHDVAAGKVYAYSEGGDTWTEILAGLTVDKPLGFATLGDKTIFGNGVDDTYQTRGTALSTSVIASAPDANVFAVFGQKVYALNTESATSTRNTIYFSATADATTWDTVEDNFAVDADSQLFGIARARSRLWNMTRKTARTWNGTNENPEVGEFGIVNPRAVVGTSNSIFGFSRRGVWGLIAGELDFVSRRIDDYIQSIDPANYDSIAMGRYRDFVLMAVGDTNAYGEAPALTDAVFILDTSTGDWKFMSRTPGVSFAEFIDSTGGEYLVMGTSDGRVLKYPVGTTYAGSARYFRIETGWDYADLPHILKTASKIKIFTTNGKTAVAQYKLKTERGETDWRDIGGLGEYVTKKTFGMEENWIAIKIQITEASKADGMQFHGYVLEGKTSGDL